MRLARLTALATLALALLAVPLAADQRVPGSSADARAQRLLYSGQIARAIEVWQGALHDEPDNWDMLSALGATLYADGQFARAVGYLQRAQAVRPDDWTLRLFLATAHHAAGQLATADAQFEAIMKGSPNRGTMQIAGDKLTRRYFQDQKKLDDEMLAKGQHPAPGSLWTGLFLRLHEQPPGLNTPNLHDDGSIVEVIASLMLRGTRWSE